MGSHSKAPNAGIDLNKVRLPSPSESDYVTPSDALASSEGVYDSLSGKDIQKIGTVSGEANIYDQNDESYATGGGSEDIPKSGSLIIETWDIGSLRDWLIFYKIYQDTSGTNDTTRLQYSLNGSDWFTLASSTGNPGPVTAGNIVKNCRYLRWIALNASSSYDHDSLDSWVYTLSVFKDISDDTIDDSLTTKWRPNPADEVNAWCRWDMGALKITSGCRIYWGADANYRPTAYRIEVSENGSTWTTMVTETEAAPASAWKEYSWNARYARYIRLIVDTHGASGSEIFEADYYSRIVERVASEHGHGSGVTKHLKVKHSKGHPVMIRGGSLRGKIRDLPSLIEYVDFMLKGLE